jgi:heat shock protein HtpX
MYSAIAKNKRNTILIIALFLVIIGGLGALTAWIVDNWWVAGITVAVAVIYAVIQYFAATSETLALTGAIEIQKHDNPRLYRIVENLAITEGMPTPRVYVINDPAPNAFATGRDPEHAVVAATTGIMDLLSPAELEGVMAHELTHVANRDVMIMTLASFFATIAAYIVQFGFLFGGGSRSDDDDNPSFMVLLLVSVAVYVISFVLMQALSRYREFAADRGAALITGRPSALASALYKISSGMHRIPEKDLRAASELNAFFIFPAGVGKGIAGLFATHPPIEKRVAALERLESQLQGTPLATAA